MRALAVLCSSLLLTAALAFTGVAQAATVTVFGAASLTEYLREGVKPAFEKANPGVTLRINLASSAECRLQIEQGAPADVFLSADTDNMDRLASANLIETPRLFAHNTLAVIVPRSNPGHIGTLRDLAKPKLKLILPAVTAPIGRYAYQVLGKMDGSGKYGKDFLRRVEANVVSNEPNVKSAVTKVLLGEADATMCYVSDVTTDVAPRVKMLRLPANVNVVADYPVAVIRQSRQKALARKLMSFITSDQGQSLLEKHGLMPAKPAKR